MPYVNIPYYPGMPYPYYTWSGGKEYKLVGLWPQKSTAQREKRRQVVPCVIAQCHFPRKGKRWGLYVRNRPSYLKRVKRRGDVISV